jgi:hypothetical protein
MKELLQAIDEYLVAQDMLDRQHTRSAEQLRNRKRGVLNSVRVKYQKQQQAAEQQTAMFAAQEQP